MGAATVAGQGCANRGAFKTLTLRVKTAVIAQAMNRLSGANSHKLVAMMKRSPLLAAAVVSLFLSTSLWAADQKYPDVVGVQVRSSGGDTFDFDVTVSSPYDSPQRYADAFRVTGPKGEVYGERSLAHDHAGEQPFTRDLYGVTVPKGVRSVSVQGRDQRFGYGGKTFEARLPGR